MRDYWVSGGKTYGLFDEYVLEQFILKVTGNVSNEDPKPEDVLIVDIECEEDNCFIGSIEESLGFPDGENSEIHDDFPMKLLANDEKDNQVIGKMADMPKIFTCNKDSRNVEKKKPFNYVLVLPLPSVDSKEIKFKLIDENGISIDFEEYEIVGSENGTEENVLGPKRSGNKVIVKIPKI